ncbi:MAG: DinB family protein [Candidatus Promineifilaceae bacterium]|nr:DinB family protein [Candidatus Promineifilaceae bacterium]
MNSGTTPGKGGLIDLLFKHNNWANLRLLDACGALSQEQLGHEAAGTYGTIIGTMTHLVRAQERYLYHLDGYESSEPAQITIKDLHKRASESGEVLRQFAQNITEDRVLTIGSEEPEEIPAFVILLQALHHAEEHRAQVASIMGRLGVEPPGLSGWDYFDEVLAGS